MDENIQPITVGESVVLGFGGDPAALRVRITQRNVAPARETALQKFFYTPRIWASSVASLVVVVLLGTAFASGTIRPAPPPLPTLAPGAPTPTPDTRGVFSLGGIQLVGLPAAATATPRPAPPSSNETVQPTPGIGELTVFYPTPVDEQPTPVTDDAPPVASVTCNQVIRLGCPNPRPVAPQIAGVQVAATPTPASLEISVGGPETEPTPATAEIPGDAQPPPTRQAQQYGGVQIDSGLPVGRELPKPSAQPGSDVDEALQAATTAVRSFEEQLQDGSGPSDFGGKP